MNEVFVLKEGYADTTELGKFGILCWSNSLVYDDHEFVYAVTCEIISFTFINI